MAVLARFWHRSSNGCGCPKLTEWELAPLHWIHPGLVHIGKGNVGTLVKLRLSQERYLQCIITRPDNLGDNTLCVTSYAFNGTFHIGHLEEIPLDCEFVQCLQEYQIVKQTCTSVCTGCLHHMKSSRCCQSSGAVLSGFWWFWLGSLPYHLINGDDRGFSCAIIDLDAHSVHIVTCKLFQWALSCSTLINVVYSVVDLNHNVAAIYCFLFIFEALIRTVCLHWINVLFEVGIVHWLCLSSHSTMDVESHSILHLYLKNACKLESHRGGGYSVQEMNKNVAKYVHDPAALCRDAGNIK